MKEFCVIVIICLILLISSEILHTKYKPRKAHLDNVVLVVQNMDTVIKQFRDSGFCIESMGRTRDDITSMAMITFEDGTHLELVSPNKPETIEKITTMRNDGELSEYKMKHNLDRNSERLYIDNFSSNDGLKDYAIRVKDVKTIVPLLDKVGLSYSDVKEMGYIKPNGKTVVWHVSTSNKRGMPQILSDHTPVSFRRGVLSQHDNGVKGIKRVVVAVKNLNDTVERYKRLVGERCIKPANYYVEGALTTDIIFKNTIITLAQPMLGGSDIDRYVKEYTEGPYMLELVTNNKKFRKILLTGSGTRVSLIN
tara:strand:- start:140 stop:1066 length:927 start_codon:yes stop_codon:yes gene_type:complete